MGRRGRPATLDHVLQRRGRKLLLKAEEIVHEPVRAAIVLRASRVGANLTLLGSIAPSHAHERVSLEQLRGRRWATIARPKLGAHSSFAVRRSLLGHSVERFRVVVAADAHNSRSVSLVLVIPVS